MNATLEFLENWIKISDYIDMRKIYGDGQHTHMCLIQHDMVIKWSIYLDNYTNSYLMN
jgi:hypothetical protein